MKRAPKRQFFGYGAAARALEESGCGEEMPKQLVEEVTGISASRLNTVRRSALYAAMCTEETKGAKGKKGYSVIFRKSELVAVFRALETPVAQARLVVDAESLSAEDFMRKYNGRPKHQVFDGEHALIESDADKAWACRM